MVALSTVFGVFNVLLNVLVTFKWQRSQPRRKTNTGVDAVFPGMRFPPLGLRPEPSP
jgi:hypothetical protein